MPEGIENCHDKPDNNNISKSVSSKSRYSDNSESDAFKSDDLGPPIKNRRLNKTIIELTSGSTSDNCTQVNKNQNKNTDNVRRSDRLKNQPPVHYYQIDNDGDDECILSAQSVLDDIPNSYEEIKARADKSKWQVAIEEELKSLSENNTWSLVPRPLNKNVVDNKWVFSIKYDEFGRPQRYKARLVARGFSQEYLVDFNETFAPVARIASFRFIICLANQFNLFVHHMDVKTAFLNGKLDEEIFMEVPKGVDCNKNYVCKLNKALYGLKQAARCWFQVFEQALVEKGFIS